MDFSYREVDYTSREFFKIFKVFPYRDFSYSELDYTSRDFFKNIPSISLYGRVGNFTKICKVFFFLLLRNSLYRPSLVQHDCKFFRATGMIEKEHFVEM